jgi:hypothetical protein
MVSWLRAGPDLPVSLLTPTNDLGQCEHGRSARKRPGVSGFGSEGMDMHQKTCMVGMISPDESVEEPLRHPANPHQGSQHTIHPLPPFGQARIFVNRNTFRVLTL